MSSADYGARTGRPEAGGEARILDELHALAAGRASGALRIDVDGDPGGAVYLDEGRLVFAEAAGVPDLGVRLVGSRWLSPEEWQALRGAERAPGGLGELLVERGLIGRDDMLAVLRSASLDAITALAVPVTGRPSVTGLWFASRERSWAGSMLTLEIESVRSEMTRRARLLAGVDFSLDALPVGSDLRRPYGVIDHDQWRVACGVDGVTPLRELVWRNGLGLYDTVESVGGLIREGLYVLLAPGRVGEGGTDADVAPARVTRVPDQAEAGVPDQAEAGGADPPWAAAPILAAPTPVDESFATESLLDAGVSIVREHDTSGTEQVRASGYAEVPRHGDSAYQDSGRPGAAEIMPPMPRRRPGAFLWDRVQADMQSAGLPQGLRQAARTAFTPATPDLLRRLLRGLRELDEDDPAAG